MLLLLVVSSMTTAFAADDPSGILKSPDIKGVTVNGNPATSGMTILSGATVKTTAAGAQISIAGVGTIVLGPNSTAVISYTGTTVTVNLTAGSISITSIRGISSSLTDPNGNSKQGDPTKDNFVIKYPDDGRQQPLIIGGGARIPPAGWFAIIGGAVAAVALPVVLSSSNTRP